MPEASTPPGRRWEISFVGGLETATEWSGGSVINLGGLPGSTSSYAEGINDAGQAVEFSMVGGLETPTEWSGGGVISLGGLPGAAYSLATGINDAGQAVGYSVGNPKGTLPPRYRPRAF